MLCAIARERQTGRERQRQTDRQRERERDRQTDRGFKREKEDKQKVSYLFNNEQI